MKTLELRENLLVMNEHEQVKITISLPLDSVSRFLSDGSNSNFSRLLFKEGLSCGIFRAGKIHVYLSGKAHAELFSLRP
jgi:hypothetical protein